MKHILLGLCAFALATATVHAQHNPCVASSVFWCDPAPTVTLAPANPIALCLCETVWAATTTITNVGVIWELATDESCATITRTIAYSYPTIVSNWTVVYWNDQWTTNSGLSASFTPASVGSGTITFYSQYTTPDPCGATNITETSVSVLVTNCAIAITRQPASQTVVVGGTATFNVAACGGAALSYQWSLNGTNIAGATADSYTRRNVQLADLGNYVVAVSNSLGNFSSSVAVLTVYDPGCITAPAGLVGWWAGEANALDFSATNNGVLQGGAGFAIGKVGQALDLDGVSQYVDIPDNPALNPTTSITVEAWVYSRPPLNPVVTPIMSKAGGGGSGQDNGYTLELTASDGVRFRVFLDGQGWVSTVSAPLPPNTWSHVAAVYDGATLFLSLNGSLVGSPTAASGSIAPSASSLQLGHDPANPDRYFNGLIDELSIYSTALSATQIHAICAAAAAGKCPDTDHDGLPDWWQIEYFGSLTNNSGGDPIKFFLTPSYQHRTNAAVSLRLEVTAGAPTNIALLVDNTNFAQAAWTNYTSTNLAVNLPSAEGRHEVWVGLRAGPGAWGQAWEKAVLILDRTPPSLNITSPTELTTSRPILQVQGLSPEPLATVAFDLNNASGTFANQQGFVTGQCYDTNTLDFSTNYFQCYDIRLAPGINTLTLRATDMAGNLATTNLTVNFTLAGDTNPPLVKFVWPLDGMHLSGNTFYVRGTIDDETATVRARVAGNTHDFRGLVERNGMFWVENLPLTDETTTLDIIATDAAGNESTNTISVHKSPLAFTVSAPSGTALYDARVTVSGTVPSGYSVTVNGVSAIVTESSWYAEHVPVCGKGTATFDAVATLPQVNTTPLTLDCSQEVEMPSFIGTVEHHVDIHCHWHADDGTTCDTDYTKSKHFYAIFNQGVDGTWHQSFHGTNYEVYKATSYPDGFWEEQWSAADPVGLCHETYVWDGVPDESTGPPAWDKSVPQTSITRADGEQTLWITHYFAGDVQHTLTASWWHENLAIQSAKTIDKLYAGGKPGATGTSLFRLYVYAEKYGKPEWIYGNWWYNPPAQRIDPTLLEIQGKHPDSDGYLWLALPDNSEEDVTVHAPFKHFGASTGATKYSNIDLDVDSDNNNGFDRPDCSDHEDEIEAQTPGKFIPINNGDADSDGIPDFADGYEKYGDPNDPGVQGAHFVPMLLNMPANISAGIDRDKVKIKFTYLASPPADVQDTTNPDGSHTYTPAPGGGIRVWTQDGTQFRKMAPINNYVDQAGVKVRAGDYVAPGIVYAVTNLPESTLYIEGIQNGSYTIKVELDPDGRSGFLAQDEVVVTVIGVDLDIDSDNNNGTKPPDRSAAEDQIEDDPTKLGKIVYVNIGDADHDGIPDFADGFDLDGINGNSDDTSETNHFVPLVLEIPPGIDVNAARLTLGYDASDPAGVIHDTNTGVWQPADGYLRIWRKDADQPRNKSSANAPAGPGDYVAPGVYSPAQLGFSESIHVVTNYLEGIRISGSRADRRITVELDPSGDCGIAITKDAVRVTVIGAEIVEATGDTTVEIRSQIKDSHAAPYFDGVSVFVGALHSSTDGTRLLGTIQITGNIRSDLCNLTPGPEGMIGSRSGGALQDIVFSLNGEPLTNGTNVNFSQPKSAGDASFTKPYATHTEFNLIFNEVDVSTGLNFLRLAATDKVPGVGLTGFAEYSWTVTATMNPTAFSALNSPAPAAAESGPYSGWSFQNSPPTLVSASEGGEIHAYYARFTGPPDVLASLAAQYPNVATGPDGKVYAASPADTPLAHCFAALTKLRPLPPEGPHDAEDEFAGFCFGMGTQSWDNIKTLGKLVFYTVQIPDMVDNYQKASFEVAFGAPNDQQLKLVIDVGTKAEQLSRFVQGTCHLWLAAAQHEWNDLKAAASGEGVEPPPPSETSRWLAAYLVEAAVAINNEYVAQSAFERGKIKGRITLEALLIALPATKAVQVSQASKVAALTKLSEVPWIREDEQLLNILNRVIELTKGNKPVPPIIGFTAGELEAPRVGFEAAGEAERIWGAYASKVASGTTKNQAILEAMQEVLANTGEIKVAARFKQVTDFRRAKLPHAPSAAEYDEFLTVLNWKSVKANKGILVAENDETFWVVRGADGYEGNHIVATKLQKALKGPPYNLPITNPDDSPVGILTIADHQTGDSAFHKLMNEYKSGIFHDSKIGNIGQDPSYPTPTAVIDEYIKFLKSIESDPRFSDYSKAGRGFAAKFNIPITQ